MRSSVPPPVLAALHRVEPASEFTQSGHQVQSLKTNRCYFVKYGSTEDIEQFEGEAASLRVMYAACPGICPRLFECSVDEATQRPIFVSEYKRIAPLNKDAGRQLGEMLAEMHLNGTSPNSKFGFDIPTYCGRTRMRNGWDETWAAAYDKKLGDLLNTLKETGSHDELCKLGSVLREKAIPRLLGPLMIHPVILHGDLWSGNAGSEEGSNNPVIFDPSSYYGHNEADLSIARIFGGFPPVFFSAYHEKIPPAEPAEEYEIRGALYEVFHYLNHAVLFGGSYGSMAYQKMGIVIRYVLHNKKLVDLVPCSDPFDLKDNDANDS